MDKLDEVRLYICDPNKNINCTKESCYINGGDCRTTIYEKFKKEDDSYPSIDIVRCKDCKHYRAYRYNNAPRGDGYCNIARLTNEGQLYINVSDEHYCSYGERTLLHYVRVPENNVVIDFDSKDGGVHLHHLYASDPFCANGERKTNATD